ncbi:hypothetical protein [Spirosoma jeollabukense]
MTIETFNLAITIGEIVGAILFLRYVWKKTDWKQEREFKRLMDTRDWDKLPEKPRSPNPQAVTPGSGSTSHRFPLE